MYLYICSNTILNITWTKGGSPLPAGGKYEVQNYGREFHVKQVQVLNKEQSVEGNYTCKAELPGHSTEEPRVHLTVVAPPVFTDEGRLNDIKVPLGSNAEFMCQTYSHRSYAKPVVWLRNGEPLAGCVRPKAFECKKRLGNGRSQCLAASKRCDSVDDCSDGSDEHCCPRTCNEGKLCNNTCIPNDQECVPAPCNYDNFQCRDKSSCIRQDQVCDNNNDCADGSDEVACPGSDVQTIGRFTLQGDRTKLTLREVTLNDSMCIQCMVANDYGTLFGDGCLTVIDKIKILKEPNATYLLKPGENVTVGVDAQHSDKKIDCDIKYEWFWVDKNNPNKVEELSARKYPNVFKFSQKSKDLTITLPEIKENSSYETYKNLTNRQYFVNIGHRYENITKTFMVEGIEVKPPNSTTPGKI